MGEQRRWVVSVDEETHRLAEQWQADFSPLVGNNRSSLVRLVFKTLDRLGFTAATLTAALHQPQQLREAIAEQAVLTPINSSQVFSGSGAELGKKPLVRVPSSEVGANRLALGNVSRRTGLFRSPTAVSVASVAMVAWFPRFPGKISPIKSNSYVSARVA